MFVSGKKNRPAPQPIPRTHLECVKDSLCFCLKQFFNMVSLVIALPSLMYDALNNLARMLNKSLQYIGNSYNDVS